MRSFRPLAAIVLVLLLCTSGPVRAEVPEVRIAQQFGISYLPFDVMKHEKLLEQEAARRGLPDLKVTWTNLGGGSAMNDALLSGSIDFVSAGVAPFITLWAKTRGNFDVRGVAALGSMPVYLVGNRAGVTSIRDLSPTDRIALPAPKVGYQAVLLQMAAAQAFGEDQFARLDTLTVAMAHPDGYTALTSGRSEITAHFGGPPYQELELAKPGAHLLLNSFDVLGGPSTFNIVYTKASFHDRNPKVYAAFLAALQRAMELIAGDPDQAVRIYLAEDTMTLDPTFLRSLVTAREVVYTTTPQGVMKFHAFMLRTGQIKVPAQGWQDLFFPEIHAAPGS